MTRQILIAVAALCAGALGPWFIAITPSGENRELDPEYIGAAIAASAFGFVVAWLSRWARIRVVLDARARRARDVGLPAAQMSLALAAYAGLDRGREASERLSEALGLAAAGPLSSEARDRVLAVATSVTGDLATVRREVGDAIR